MKRFRTPTPESQLGIVQLLDIIDTENPEAVAILFKKNRSYERLALTLEAVESDPIRRQQYMSFLLKHGIEAFHMLNGKYYHLDDVDDEDARPVSLIRTLRFGAPSYEDVKSALVEASREGEDPIEHEHALLRDAIKDGWFDNLILTVPKHTEFCATDEVIADEVAQLRQDLGF